MGDEHPRTVEWQAILAAIYLVQERFREAAPLFQRVLAVQAHMLGKDHPDTHKTVHNLAVTYFQQGDFKSAAELWRQSTGAIAQQMLRAAGDTGQTASKSQAEAKRAFWHFRGLVMAKAAPLTREIFQTAQWALDSEAARSLAQMAARGAKGDPKLAALLWERQDLVAEWQRRDGLRTAARAEQAARRNPQAEAENQARLDAVDGRIAEIDKRLQSEFPDFASLSSPAPLSVEEVQAQLGPDEALVVFLDAGEMKPAPDESSSGR